MRCLARWQHPYYTGNPNYRGTVRYAVRFCRDERFSPDLTGVPHSRMRSYRGTTAVYADKSFSASSFFDRPLVPVASDKVITEVPQEEVVLTLVRAELGAVTQSDVEAAALAKAPIFAFNVGNVPPQVKVSNCTADQSYEYRIIVDRFESNSLRPAPAFLGQLLEISSVLRDYFRGTARVKVESERRSWKSLYLVFRWLRWQILSVLKVVIVAVDPSNGQAPWRAGVNLFGVASPCVG